MHPHMDEKSSHTQTHIHIHTSSSHIYTNPHKQLTPEQYNRNLTVITDIMNFRHYEKMNKYCKQ